MNIKNSKRKEGKRLIGIENLILLSRVFGGTSIYIPKEEELLKGLKYDKIAEEFTEKNAKELGKRKEGKRVEKKNKVVKKIEELSEVMTALTKLTIEVGTLLFAIKLVIISCLYQLL